VKCVYVALVAQLSQVCTKHSGFDHDKAKRARQEEHTNVCSHTKILFVWEKKRKRSQAGQGGERESAPLGTYWLRVLLFFND